jgi:hypothetical protein
VELLKRLDLTEAYGGEQAYAEVRWDESVMELELRQRGVPQGRLPTHATRVRRSRRGW